MDTRPHKKRRIGIFTDTIKHDSTALGEPSSELISFLHQKPSTSAKERPTCPVAQNLQGAKLKP
jgi:hypothetical protein